MQPFRRTESNAPGAVAPRDWGGSEKVWRDNEFRRRQENGTRGIPTQGTTPDIPNVPAPSASDPVSTPTTNLDLGDKTAEVSSRVRIERLWTDSSLQPTAAPTPTPSPALGEGGLAALPTAALVCDSGLSVVSY